jgi:hypothetical protein
MSIAVLDMRGGISISGSPLSFLYASDYITDLQNIQGMRSYKSIQRLYNRTYLVYTKYKKYGRNGRKHEAQLPENPVRGVRVFPDKRLLDGL